MRRLSPLAALLITLALSAALAAACGGDTDDRRAPQSQEQAAAIEAVEQAAPPEQPQRAAAVPAEAERQEQSSAGVSSEPRQQTELRQSGPIVAPLPLDEAYALELLRAIAEEIGPRSVGQLGERRMVDFLGEALRGDGYEVAIEPFDFVGAPAGHTVAIVSQLGGAATMSVTVPVALMERSPDVLAAGRIVVVPGVGTAADFASVETEGAAAVVQRGELTFSEKQRNAEAAGAVALFVVDPDGPFNGVLTADEPGQIPVFALPPELGEHLRENEGGTATIGVREDVIFESWNVVARRPGGECRVVVGGHYDSVPQVQGANDNASGIGLTLALARAWADASSADYVCFVGFGAEELGLHGSHAFVDAALESREFETITAMLNLDAIGNGQRPIIAAGDAALATLLERLGKQLEIDVRQGTEPEGIRSDHTAFQNKGVPVIFPAVAGGILHVPADNTENIDEALLLDVGLLAHAMLECLLERAGASIEPRLSCDAEEQ